MTSTRKRKADEKWLEHKADHHYSVTFNAPDQAIFKKAHQLLSKGGDVATRGQTEAAPTTGRLHLQCYYYFRKAKDPAAAKRWLISASGDPSPHVVRCRDLQHAQHLYHEYVRKEGGLYQWSINEDIIPEYIRSRKSTTKDQVEGISWETDRKQVEVWLGPPKLGKNYMMQIILGYLGDEVYYLPGKAKNQSGRWLGDYKGQPIVVIDEFHYNDFDDSYWKMLLDPFSTQALTTKMGGASVEFNPKLIFLLANCTKYKSGEPRDIFYSSRTLLPVLTKDHQVIPLDADPDAYEGCPHRNAYLWLKNATFRYRVSNLHYMGGVPVSQLHMKILGSNF